MRIECLRNGVVLASTRESGVSFEQTLCSTQLKKYKGCLNKCYQLNFCTFSIIPFLLDFLTRHSPLLSSNAYVGILVVVEEDLSGGTKNLEPEGRRVAICRNIKATPAFKFLIMKQYFAMWLLPQ